MAIWNLKNCWKVDEDLTKNYRNVWNFLILVVFFWFFSMVHSQIRYRPGLWHKPKKLRFLTCLFAPILFAPQKLGSEYCWYRWLGRVLASSRSQNTAWKILKHKRKFFFNYQKLAQNGKKVDFLKDFKCKHAFLLDSSERSRENLSCNVLLWTVQINGC